MILPAIDLLEGRVVRLRQGRFDRAKVYSDDPLAVARAWVDQGAEALHLVDLEGARLGRAKNLDWIYRIRAAFPDPLIQVGGGIRTFALAARLLKAGIDRIVLGTAAAENPALLDKLARTHGADRLVAALDLRRGVLAVEGWETESGRALEDVLTNMEALGVRTVACTDITRDGTLRGPGLEVARTVIDRGFRVIVAGGIGTAGEIAQLRELGAAGCILGTALMEGTISLAEALEAARAD